MMLQTPSIRPRSQLSCIAQDSRLFALVDELSSAPPLVVLAESHSLPSHSAVVMFSRPSWSLHSSPGCPEYYSHLVWGLGVVCSQALCRTQSAGDTCRHLEWTLDLWKMTFFLFGSGVVLAVAIHSTRHLPYSAYDCRLPRALRLDHEVPDACSAVSNR